MRNFWLFLLILLVLSGVIVLRSRQQRQAQSQNYQAELNAAAPATNNDAQTATTSGSDRTTTNRTNLNQENTVKTLTDFTPLTAKTATIVTSRGEIVVELYPDKAPLTVTNFLTLAKEGFYNGIKFHRIIENFMAQAGDPLTKDDTQKSRWGTGGPGYTIADEFDASLKHDGEGILSMANTGMPNTGGSQFFITYEATPWLDGKHAVFGKVTQGMDVLRQLQIGDQITAIRF